MARLDGKVAVITGAGSGIGRVSASLFAAEGAGVVVADVAADQAESAVADILSAGGSATAVTVDVSDERQVEAMVACAVDTYGRLDVLFNNAGIFPDDDGGVLDTPPDTWQKVMEVNLKGVWLGCRAAVPAMLESGGGSIVNVASFVALMGAATAQIAYTASKGGVLAMTRELAVGVRPSGDQGQLDLSRAHRDTAAGRAPVRPGPAPATPRAHPDRTIRPSGGDRQGGPVPGLRRRLVRHRVGLGGRRGHHRGVRHAGMKLDE